MSFEPNFIGIELGPGGRSSSDDPDNTDKSNVDVGGCTASDIIASRCIEVFEVDPVVIKFFGDGGVELWDLRPFLDFRDYPMIYITPSTTTDEQVPNQESLTNVELFFGVRYPIESLSPRRPWEPGIASLVNHLKTLINRHLQTVEFFIKDQCVQVARSSVPGVFSPFVDASADGERFALTQEFSWVWRLILDNQTGLPVDVAQAVALP